MHTVQNILAFKEKAVNFIEPDTLVIDALEKLMNVNLSYMIVMEGDKFLGLFSERDYTRNLVLKGRSSRDTMVKEVMSTTDNLPVVDPKVTVEACMYMMNLRGSRYLLAFDEDHFLGVITIHDVMREIISNKDKYFDNELTSSLINADETGKIF